MVLWRMDCIHSESYFSPKRFRFTMYFTFSHLQTEGRRHGEDWGHARQRPAHQEQLGVQCLAQGCYNTRRSHGTGIEPGTAICHNSKSQRLEVITQPEPWGCQAVVALVPVLHLPLIIKQEMRFIIIIIIITIIMFFKCRVCFWNDDIVILIPCSWFCLGGKFTHYRHYMKL